MDIIQVIKERRSIRTFIKKEIPEELLAVLIDALIWAPSAGNLQSRKFLFVKDEKIKRRIAGAALNQHFIHEAPLAVVCCADSGIGRHYGQRGIDLYTIQDVSVSIMAMMLVAHEKGLGTCWVGAFHEDDVSAVLNLPSQFRPVAIVPIGYPARIPEPPPRVLREEAVEFL